MGLAAPNADNNGNGAAPDAATLVTRLNDDVAARLQSGRDLLTAGDPRSEPTLRAAAQGALQLLKTSTGTDVLEAAPGTLPDDALTRALATQAAQAHLWWGVSAQKFAGRDEAITALSRAKRLLSAAPATPMTLGAPDTLARDINLELGKELTAGLPLIAPDDVLGDIAQLMHGDRWTPREFDFAVAGQSAVGAKTAIAPAGHRWRTVSAAASQQSRASRRARPRFYAEPDRPRSCRPRSSSTKWSPVTRSKPTAPTEASGAKSCACFTHRNFLTEGKRNDLPRARQFGRSVSQGAVALPRANWDCPISIHRWRPRRGRDDVVAVGSLGAVAQRRRRSARASAVGAADAGRQHRPQQGRDRTRSRRL